MVLHSKGNSYHNASLLDYTQGIVWDQQLVKEEIQVQIAWLALLVEANVLTKLEADALEVSLLKIGEDMQTGVFPWQVELEDIHMNIEQALTLQHGPLGKKVHTGRSRNDLIATTLRLHCANIMEETTSATKDIVSCLIAKAEQTLDIIIPGMTHMQNGQPIRLSQVLLAHAHSFLRDIEKFEFAKGVATRHMPLGAGAMNGTTLSGDYSALAKRLGFQASCANSYDAVCDRDFLLEAMQGMAGFAVHVSKLCNDIIYWASTPVGLVVLPDDWSTGSSIMPQKRNPDIAEISRAKAARIMSHSHGAMEIVRGLSSSYFSDLHELKKHYLETVQLVQEMQSVLPPFLKGLTFDSAAAETLCNQGHILATDLANQLVAGGMPFREAYLEVAQAVAKASTEGKQIHEVAGDRLSMEGSVEARRQSGGTARDAILSQIKTLKQFI